MTILAKIALTAFMTLVAGCIAGMLFDEWELIGAKIIGWSAAVLILCGLIGIWSQ